MAEPPDTETMLIVLDCAGHWNGYYRPNSILHKRAANDLRDVGMFTRHRRSGAKHHHYQLTPAGWEKYRARQAKRIAEDARPRDADPAPG